MVLRRDRHVDRTAATNRFTCDSQSLRNNIREGWHVADPDYGDGGTPSLPQFLISSRHPYDRHENEDDSFMKTVGPKEQQRQGDGNQHTHNKPPLKH
jgi:hypothetical protein